MYILVLGVLLLTRTAKVTACSCCVRSQTVLPSFLQGSWVPLHLSDKQLWQSVFSSSPVSYRDKPLSIVAELQHLFLHAIRFSIAWSDLNNFAVAGHEVSEYWRIGSLLNTQFFTEGHTVSRPLRSLPLYLSVTMEMAYSVLERDAHFVLGWELILRSTFHLKKREFESAKDLTI